MRRDVLHASHEDYQGGHQGITRTYDRVRGEYYWPRMFRDVEEHVRECVDCATAKGRPPNPGPSPGNLRAEYPFQVLTMDFVMPLPESANGNTALLLFQDQFSGFVMSACMSDTSAQSVAEVYDRVVFQRFGASAIVRHDRDPRFMSEVFRCFRTMLGSQQRATLAYRPQANGQQERSVQTVIRSVRAYVEEPGQSDWEDIVGRLMFALNTSYDATRKETPFYLVHGWDATTTLRAMLTPPPRGRDLLDAYVWRLRVQREHQLAQAWALDLQDQARRLRADRQNASWEALPAKFKQGFNVGDQVWLYLARVRPGLSKKLAHCWHGPFRIAERDEAHRVKLVVDGSGHRVYPWVHVSRLKPRVLHEDRPTEAPDVTDTPAEAADPDDPDDFDAALLPEDSWEPDEHDGVFEVEALLDVRWVTSGTRSGRRHKEYLVKWHGYDEPDWVRLEQLNCGRLIYEFDQTRRAQSRFAAMQSADEAEESLQ
ncbi:hypothetical protein P43SY_011274 [Pythium insidiosum]|uniref:Reverse transcriptase n=1 Tax=Pythium insidiosum TaxID=114742 RepID=A0AAD5LQZ4_PYTIN|nr:hypothetical protein P43SY_011274 [Pythium insidiosum]